MAEKTVVDANPIMSALLGGEARGILLSSSFDFLAPQHTLFEVEKYLEVLARRIHEPVLDLLHQFQSLPIAAFQQREYDHSWTEAWGMIGARDPKDTHVVALALAQACPIWSNDKDVRDLPGVVIYTTAEMLTRVRSTGRHESA